MKINCRLKNNSSSGEKGIATKIGGNPAVTCGRKLRKEKYRRRIVGA
jgi:hypothetical protein